MKTVDDRLRAAATETREYAATRWPTPPTRILTKGPRPKGWLVFAVAFAAVIVAFVTLPLLVGMEESETASQPDPLTTPTTLAGPTTTRVAEGDCSVSGAPVPGPVEGLPSPVAETRAAIIDAAVRCDIQAVIDLAGPGFITSFGGGDAEELRRWERDGEGRLGTLLEILAMSHGVKDDGEGGQIYVWPAAFAYDTWEEIPPEAVAELSSLYSEDELDLISRLDAYGGWRTGIDETGDWMYFVAGD